MAAIIIGFGAGAVCYFCAGLKSKFGFDDALDVWAVHGMGGTWGAIATGLFATVAINALPPAGGGGNGLFYGNPAQFGIQIIAVLASWAYSAVMTFVLLKVVDATIGLRVPEHEELAGLDMTQHGELAYQV